MRVNGYELELFTPPCEPGAERYSAVAHLSISIAEVLPYLNATLSGAKYMPSANALTWKRADHLVAFHANRVAVSNVIDREEAVDKLERMIDLVNRTWDRRAEITPDYQAQKRPPPMAIYQQLPRTNCRECGEATCMGFAFGLIQGNCTLEECPALTAEQLAALQLLL
ncbi:MAG: (Fe-S)-binding protein [Chloroflexota bacterium]|jgi:ArsR family metal-binding transcriptional regulator